MTAMSIAGGYLILCIVGSLITFAVWAWKVEQALLEPEDQADD